MSKKKVIVKYKKSSIPTYRWDLVAALEEVFHRESAELGASIGECSIAFNQFVIHQTQRHERESQNARQN